MIISAKAIVAQLQFTVKQA